VGWKGEERYRDIRATQGTLGFQGGRLEVRYNWVIGEIKIEV
jgi:hypothetical protein